MAFVDPKSLAGTLANLNQALLEGAFEKLAQAEREETAGWIAGRAGVPGSYRGLPAPTPQDYHTRLKLFTGETVGSHAGTGCKLGFEATWALAVLRPKRRATVAAAELSRQRAIERFDQETARRRGMYCCYSCSVAGWRALGSAADATSAELLEQAMHRLRSHRDGKGRWRKFPVWYTLLALSDLKQPQALEELRYAVPALERALRAEPRRDIFSRRRRLLAQHILGRVGR